MIISRLPATPHLIRFPGGNMVDKYLCVIEDERRVAVFEGYWSGIRRNFGWVELAEITQENIHMDSLLVWGNKKPRQGSYRGRVSD